MNKLAFIWKSYFYLVLKIFIKTFFIKIAEKQYLYFWLSQKGVVQ